MYNFDGNYRRQPVQNLGGSSVVIDRETLIKNVQMQRQKRAELRLQNTAATVVQSYYRSYLARQMIKGMERKCFDDCYYPQGIQSIQQFEYLLTRFLFFYSRHNTADSERLEKLSQFMVKQKDTIIKLSLSERTWTHRLRKFIYCCLQQITTDNLPYAMPLRTIETYLLEDSVRKVETNNTILCTYFEYIYVYLMQRKYFKNIRIFMEQHSPPLDEPVKKAPSLLISGLFELIFIPLKLMHQPFLGNECKEFILWNFTKEILIPEHSDIVKFYVLPNMKDHKDFKFDVLVHHIAHYLKNSNDLPATTTFLLYSLLQIDQQLHENELSLDLWTDYLSIIAATSSNINKLRKKSILMTPFDFSMAEGDSDSDNDDVDDRLQLNISRKEHNTLLEILDLLNDSRRAHIIVDQIEYCIETPNLILSVCQICHNLMIHNKLGIFEYKLLYMLAFKPKFVRTLWYTMTSQSHQLGFSSPLSLLSKGLVIPKQEADRIIPMLATFCSLFGRLISTLHDGEFCQDDVLPGLESKIMPFRLPEIVTMSTVLKEISLGLVELAYPETRANLNEHYRNVLHSRLDDSENNVNKQVWPHLLKTCVSLLNQLYTRDLRCSFCPEGHWTVQNLNLPLDKPNDLHLTTRNRRLRPFQPISDFTRDDLIENGPPLSTKQIRSIVILREIPFVVSFNSRVAILQRLIASDKIKVQGEYQGYLQGPSIQIAVRRTHIYEDSFDKLRPENEPDLRHKFRVQMVNTYGLEEVGIDGGGIFREYMSELLKTAFDPNRGFFLITTDNKLYPNPSVAKIVPDFQKHYYFIGRILGKAIYENLLVELPLAGFFISKLAGKHSDVDIHQLASLDPELHKNLLSLKAFTGDVSDLGLDFTVVHQELGETKSEDLKLNGSNTPVTRSNIMEYIQLMADYKLNKQIKYQCAAFRQGLANVLPIEWLYMFSNKEMQVLISGAEVVIDIEDMKNYATYGGVFHAEHPTIILFWKVLEQFTDLQKRKLMKFVTSCSCPPLLGFKDLDPPFTIQSSGPDTSRLPSSSTCMNLLKLPSFTDASQLKEKLIYAIESGVGFELS